MEITGILSSIVTLVVGLFAFIIYRFEKNDGERAAASVVLEELRTIEKAIDKLNELKDFFSITPSSLSTEGWKKYRHVLVKYFDYDQMIQMSLFYERVDALKEMLQHWNAVYKQSILAKSENLQAELIRIADEVGSAAEYEAKKKKITDIVHPDGYWFEPNLYKGKILSLLELIHPISTTGVGEKIKAISKKKWYRFN